MEKYIPKVGDKFYVNGIFGLEFECTERVSDNEIYVTSNYSTEVLVLGLDVGKLEFIKVK